MSGSAQSHAVAPWSSAAKSIASQLIGVWRLVSFTDEQEGHEASFPLGPAPEGLLIYTIGITEHRTSIRKRAADTSRIAESMRWMRRKRLSRTPPPLRSCQI